MTASAMKSIIGMTTLAAALAGCSLAPKYERPVSPVEGAYPAGASYNAPDQARARAGGRVAWKFQETCTAVCGSSIPQFTIRLKRAARKNV